MRPVRLLAIVALGASVVLAACGDDDDGEGGGSTAPAQSGSPYGGGVQAGGSETASDEGNEAKAEKKEPKPGTEITVASSQFGDVLFDGSNQAIYLFDKETGSTPECYGGCAAAWPPVLTDGEPEASGAAEQGLLGTTEREDGSTQVTYAGQPLYYYAHEGPGQVLCHNVSEFGGLWLVLDASGQALS
jgi:predicted lipoprotein with Yx(FWY)xxD motif